ncbi:hypothetical protein [Priestia taiwanensis]|uniref:Uncharacterized protein n=1 Tax=Priestia taiwanensis TaxID=1347902 RepID=A0A917AXL9_9BACI|nr:hypothetical protein [Priestia taiwanensis]MBM7364662.1 hypothetical protein [Priestia taiwanensis]GGE78626.1 hypothetical protein GCM10007140_30270 [Priestia taiwanensis]
MISRFNSIFKRKGIVMPLTIIFSAIFVSDLIFYGEFNLSAFGGALYFGATLGSIIYDQKVQVSNE